MQLDPAKFVAEGLTYDDVLLLPAYSEVLPREVDTSSYLTKKIKLNIPLVSAAMDTVTEAALAIAIAQAGGLGMLHKNMSIQRQADEVRKIMREYRIGGIPVVDDKGKLKGILTNRDLRFEKDPTKPVTKIMTKDNLIT